MPYSTQIVRRARARLAQAKADRESENQEHLARAYAAVPRLRQIDFELRRTMAQAAQAVFSEGGDVMQAMARAREENLALQREREELIEANFEEGFLDDSPICDRCGGDGYVGSRMCECLSELCRQEQKKQLQVLFSGRESFDTFRLDYYPDRIDPTTGLNIRAIMERTLRTCRRYAASFSYKSGNLLLSGDTGLGKTYLSACIARTVTDAGYSVAYESAPHLFARLERAKFEADEQARQDSEQYAACDLLIIDDLGTEMPGQFVNSSLYTLLNDRILAGKPTIISTNLTSDALSKRYPPQIASRMRGSFQRVAFVGDDIRLKKNLEL